MRAVTFDPAIDRFAVRDLPVPEPGPGAVRVRVEACGLNPVDAKIIYWKGAAVDMNANWVPGLDVAGVIDAFGPGVAGWQPGDRVLYHGNMFQPHGGFAWQTAAPWWLLPGFSAPVDAHRTGAL